MLRAGPRGAPASASTTASAGLYLWATRDEDAWATVAELADLGILVAPGTFYGDAGAQHVRIALTATDERDRRGRRAVWRSSPTG